MKGFEIHINNHDPITIATNDYLSVLLLGGSDSFIYLRGKDYSYNSLTWLEDKLEIGDKIIIRVVETDKALIPSKMKEADKEWLTEYYNELNAELKEKGLI